MFDFLVCIGILFLCLFLASFVGIFVIFGFKQQISNIKEGLFLFRWFLIDRYHCDLSTKQKLYLKFIHKLFWGGVIIGWVLFLAYIVDTIKG